MKICFIENLYSTLAFRTKKSASLLLDYPLNWYSTLSAWMIVFIINLKKLLKFTSFIINSAEVRNCCSVIFYSFYKDFFCVFYYQRPFRFPDASSTTLRMYW